MGCWVAIGVCVRVVFADTSPLILPILVCIALPSHSNACLVPVVAGKQQTAARRLLYTAAGLGAACATGAALVAVKPASLSASCKEAKAQAGDFFLWGRRHTGNDIEGYCDKTPVALGLPNNSQVVHAAFGSSVGAACDRNGDVWWWGIGAGEGGNPSHMDKAQVILSGKRIVKVACASRYSYAISSNGRMWQWPNDDPRAAKEVPLPGGIFGGAEGAQRVPVFESHSHSASSHATVGRGEMPAHTLILIHSHSYIHACMCSPFPTNTARSRTRITNLCANASKL